jgi:hypothetical protein
MSGPDTKEHADYLQQEAARLRHQAAGLASSVAATEEQVADTLEEVAEHRPAVDAERLRAEAESARQCAAKERGLSNQLSNDRSPPRRTPADERGQHSAAQIKAAARLRRRARACQPEGRSHFSNSRVGCIVDKELPRRGVRHGK